MATLNTSGNAVYQWPTANQGLNQYATSTGVTITNGSSTQSTIDADTLKKLFEQYKNQQMNPATLTATASQLAQYIAPGATDWHTIKLDPVPAVPAREKTFDEICDDVINELKRA